MRPASDLDQMTYDRAWEARNRMVRAVRTLRTAAPRDDTVVAIGVLHPHALSAAEIDIVAEWEDRARQAVAEIRAEYAEVRRLMGGAS